MTTYPEIPDELYERLAKEQFSITLTGEMWSWICLVMKIQDEQEDKRMPKPKEIVNLITNQLAVLLIDRAHHA